MAMAAAANDMALANPSEEDARTSPGKAAFPSLEATAGGLVAEAMTTPIGVPFSASNRALLPAPGSL